MQLVAAIQGRGACPCATASLAENCHERIAEARHPLRTPLRGAPSKTVPALYPESPEFVAMPEVFATGFLVGFLEWACIRAINPHLDWPREQTVGTHIDVSHEAATPPGLEVTARVELIEVDGRRLVFAVEADDGVDLISRGRTSASSSTRRIRCQAWRKKGCQRMTFIPLRETRHDPIA